MRITSRLFIFLALAGPGVGSGSVTHDFDGDGKSDLAVHSRSDSTWHIRASETGVMHGDGPIDWGWNQTQPLSGDFDGDGKADVAVYWPQNGSWFVRQSSDGQMLGGQALSWGWGEAVPVPADYDGDGKTDVAVYWPAGGAWYIRQSGDGQMLGGGPVNWGWSQGIPVPADYDGDGKADIAVYWPEGGMWYVRQSSDGQMLAGQGLNWGWNDTVPVPADYDGDGKADIAVYWPKGGNWYIRQSSDGQMAGGQPQNWGWSQAAPVPGDYDGDGRSDLAVCSKKMANWYVRPSGGNASAHPTVVWGSHETLPIHKYAVFQLYERNKATIRGGGWSPTYNWDQLPDAQMQKNAKTMADYGNNLMYVEASARERTVYPDTPARRSKLDDLVTINSSYGVWTQIALLNGNAPAQAPADMALWKNSFTHVCELWNAGYLVVVTPISEGDSTKVMSRSILLPKADQFTQWCLDHASQNAPRLPLNYNVVSHPVAAPAGFNVDTHVWSLTDQQRPALLPGQLNFRVTDTSPAMAQLTSAEAIGNFARAQSPLGIPVVYTSLESSPVVNSSWAAAFGKAIGY